MKMFETGPGKRQHPLMAVLVMLRAIKEMLLPLLLLLVTQLYGGGEARHWQWRAAIAVVLLVWSAAAGFFSWLRYRYEVEDGQLKIVSGMIFTKRQFIPAERIQSIDTTEGLLHRLFGLVRVQVQTAGGKEPEATLHAVTRDEANRLLNALRAVKEAAGRQARDPAREAALREGESLPEFLPESEALAAESREALMGGTRSAESPAARPTLDGAPADFPAGPTSVGAPLAASTPADGSSAGAPSFGGSSASEPLSGASSSGASSAGGFPADATSAAEFPATGSTVSGEAGAFAKDPAFGGAGMALSAPVYAVTFPRLLLFSLSAGRMGVALSLIAAAFSQADNFLPLENVYRYLGEHFNWSAVPVVVAVLLFISYLLAVAVTVLQFYSFEVRIGKKELYLSRGLIERKRVTLPIKRIQAIRIVEEPLWQPLKFASVHVVNAGYGGEKGESTLLFPLLARSEIEPLLERLLPDFAGLYSRELDPLPKKALRSYVWPATIVVLAAAVVASFFIGWHGLGIGLPLAALAGLWGWWRHASAGWLLADERMVMRFRRISRTTVLFGRRRVQSLSVSQSPFQLRRGLASIRADIASGAGGAAFWLSGVTVESSREIRRWFRPGSFAEE